MSTRDIIKRARGFSKPFRVTNANRFRLKNFDPGETLHLDSEDKPRAKEALASGTLTKTQIFETEELTNYVGHVAYSLRYALGGKGAAGEKHAMPDRPVIPEFLRELIPVRKKGDQQRQRRPQQ